MTKRLMRQCIIYGAGVFLYCCLIGAAIHFMIPEKDKFLMFLAVYLLTGFGAFEALSRGLAEKKLQLDYLLIILATAGAFGVGRYEEGVFVMILFELGMLFEMVSLERARRSIAGMINLRPAYAVRRVQGEEERVDPSQLQFNQMIIIRPGERIPADAVVVSGKSMVDTRAVTGEMEPVAIEEGDFIYSGCVNLEEVLEARVMTEYDNSTAAKIMELVEQAQNNKAGSENLIVRLSRIYTPVMLVCAMLVMFVPPATFSYGNWDMWIYRGLIFLIVACPCGLVMSAPVAFLGGIASAVQQGILVKGGNYLEALARADTFVFDKTGTLTKGEFRIEEIKAMGISKEELLGMAANIECYSEHPIAKSLVNAYEGRVVSAKAQNVEEIPGFGISADYEGKRVHIGNFKMMEEKQVLADEEKTETGTVVYVGIDQWYAGCFILTDEIREEAYDTLSYLKDKRRASLIMLTGDTERSGRAAAEELEMDYAYTGLAPEEKLTQLEDFLFLQDDTGRLVCVGDCLNDSLVLARAEVGITMGNVGSAAVSGTAGIILMENDLSKMIDAVRIARGTLRTVSQNIVFALFVKMLVLICALIGYFGMWEAILAEAAIMFVEVLNAVWVVKYTA